MNCEEQGLVESFEREVRAQAHLRAGPNTFPQKVLLEGFRHFDCSDSSVADRKSFLNVMQLRLNLSLFSAEELEQLWRHYAGTGVLRYREFVAQLFPSAPSAPTAEPAETAQSAAEEAESAEVFKQKMTELIVFKLRQREMAAFLKLFREFALSAGDGELSLNHFTIGLRKCALDFSAEDIGRLYRLHSPNGQLDYHRFFDPLLRDHTVARAELLQRMFARLDFTRSNRLNLSLLKELFNPRAHPGCREGRLSLQEVQMQFEELLDVYVRLPGCSAVVGLAEFQRLFSFLSAHTREDKDFAAMLEGCFRYNELPTPTAGESGTAPRDLGTLRPENRLENILAQVDEQLARKGSRAYILYFKAIKCNDFDNDGFVYFKELARANREIRVEIGERQLQLLFDGFADASQKLRYALLFERLVPAFDAPRLESTRRLYERLFAAEGGQELSFQAIQAAFNPKGHPDFKALRRADYEVREEFVEALRVFLLLYKGSNLSASLHEFTRFFEFFGRNWENEFLFSLQQAAFKTRGEGEHSRQELPEVESRPVPKAKEPPKHVQTARPVSAAVKHSTKDYELNCPFYVESAVAAAPPKKPAVEVAQPVIGPRGLQALTNHLKAQNQRPEPDMDLSRAAKATLVHNIRGCANFAKILEIEFELTNKADAEGEVELQLLAGVLTAAGVDADVSESELQSLFLSFCGPHGKLHVQNFIDDLRGQMTPAHQTSAVELFKKLAFGLPPRTVAIDRLRSSLILTKAATKIFVGSSSTDVKENWDYLIDLFVCLNLASRQKNDLDMDDLLYFLDNFAFYLENVTDFETFLNNCFK